MITFSLITRHIYKIKKIGGVAFMISPFMLSFGVLAQLTVPTITSQRSNCISEGKVKILGDLTYQTTLSGNGIPQQGPFTAADFPSDTIIFSNLSAGNYTVTQTHPTTSEQATYQISVTSLHLEIVDTICAQSGYFYSIDFANQIGSTVNSSHGFISGNTISSIPTGVNVEIYISDGACSDTLLINHTCPIPYGSIGSTVYEDINGNGQQDAGDNGIEGVKVYLLSQAGVTIDSTITNASGDYNFDSLVTANYRVLFNLPNGAIFTQSNKGNDNTDSDVNQYTGISGLINIDTSLPNINIGRNNSTVFAGIVLSPVYDLSLFKFVDNGSPNLGDVLEYSVLLVNEGNSTINDIQVKDSLQSGLQILEHSSTSGSYSSSNGIWNTSMINAGDTATLMITVKVNCRGLIPNVAEIVSMGQIDEDSSPNNQIVSEDDFDSVCISVPYEICPAQNLLANMQAPSGLGTYQWFLNGNPIPLAQNSSYEANLAGNYTVTINGILYTNCEIVVTENCNCKDGICTPYLISKTN